MNSQNIAIIEAPLNELHPPSYLISTISPDDNGTAFKGKGFVIFSKPDSTYELLETEKYFFSAQKCENDWLQTVKSKTLECYHQGLMREIDNAVIIQCGSNSSDVTKQKSKEDISQKITKHISEITDVTQES